LLTILIKHPTGHFRHEPALQLELILDALVVFPSSKLSMVTRPVGLNGELLLRPGEIDFRNESIVLDHSVAFDGRRQAKLPQEAGDI